MSAYHRPKKYPAAEFASTPASAEPLPVVIAGAGPVGLAVALGLVRRGVPVTVLEASDQVSYGSRAICIARHSLEVAERLGFGAVLEEFALPWVGGRTFYRDREVLRFAMPHGPLDVRAPMVNVSQSELEQLMVDALEAEPLATLHWSSSVQGVTQSPDGVTVEIATSAGVRTLRTRWLVAADGGRSRTRELLGLRLSGTSYTGSYVIADIHWPSDLPAERRVWFDPPSNPGSTIIMHRQPNDIWRIDYQLDGAEDPEAEAREDRIRDRITRHLAWLRNDVPWTLEWHGFYRAHALALPEFVHDRVIFAGDAAHLVPIFGVRGLNSGLEDAETLSWQLAAVVAGNASPALLRAYSAERHDAWRQNVDNAGKSTLIMSPGTSGQRGTRDAILALAADRPEFSHLLNPRQSSATHARTSPLTWGSADGPGPRPGDPIEDRKVTVQTPSGPELTSLHRARGTGFTLLASGDIETLIVERLVKALHPEPVTLLALDDETAEAFSAGPGEIFVVRPDGLLLCRVPSAKDLEDVASHVLAGTSPRQEDSSPEPDEEREHVWLTLSRALDQATDREAFLTRLALLLGAETDAETFDAMVAAAEGPDVA